jgi:hypothetical protein
VSAHSELKPDVADTVARARAAQNRTADMVAQPGSPEEDRAVARIERDTQSIQRYNEFFRSHPRLLNHGATVTLPSGELRYWDKATRQWTKTRPAPASKRGRGETRPRRKWRRSLVTT